MKWIASVVWVVILFLLLAAMAFAALSYEFMRRAQKKGMSMYNIPDTGHLAILDATMSGLNVWVHLYTNNVDLSAPITLASFTELVAPGYAPRPARTWSPAVFAGGIAVSWADVIRWTRTTTGAATSVFGYFATSGETGPLLWAEDRPGGPAPFTDAGHQVAVIPGARGGPLCPP